MREDDVVSYWIDPPIVQNGRDPHENRIEETETFQFHKYPLRFDTRELERLVLIEYLQIEGS